ncbi:DUF2924 domain-containing protein [Leptolyngbya sp. 15MV]|nr:DUF2924 domain-containing protein [Leptolyngbya sp. 15MV]
MKTAPPTASRSIQQEIDELRDMPVSRLRERYAEIFGEPTASGNRQWLYRRVAWRIQALAEGDLSERARRRAAELARDVDVRVRPPGEPEARRDCRSTAALRRPRRAGRNTDRTRHAR